MSVNPDKGISKMIRSITQHYNSDKYWKYRSIVTDKNNKTPKFMKLYMLYYIKKCDAFNNASMGTNYNEGAFFLHLRI